MERIVLGDPAWSDTFPHRMAPHPEEAFVSLLLRCDEENGWASGRTYAHVRNLLYYPAHLPDLVVPSQRSVDTLAMRLCLPIGTIAATTYLWELMRLFETVTPSSRDLCESFVFRLCPICIKEHRVILRYHFLLGMTTCLQHRISLLSSCTCGAVLRPFAPRSSQLSWYEQFPLGDLVTLLVEHGYSPQDVLNSMKRVDLFSQLWMGRSSATVLPLDDKEENAL